MDERASRRGKGSHRRLAGRAGQHAAVIRMAAEESVAHRACQRGSSLAALLLPAPACLQTGHSAAEAAGRTPMHNADRRRACLRKRHAG